MELLPLAPAGTTPVRVMTIAGSDSGGAAGLQADLRTFALVGVHGTSAVTAVTVQNSLGVTGFHPIPAQTVAAQIRAVVDDIGVGAVKTGMLANAEIISAIADTATDLDFGTSVPFLVDPVSASQYGDPLLHPDALATMLERLFPRASVITPNLDEVRIITGIEVTDAATQHDAARALHAMGPQWVLVKGGHLRTAATSTDILFDGAQFHYFPAPRIPTRHDHGAGDTLGAAMVAALAHGYSMPAAVTFGKQWVTHSLAAAYPVGAGHGPVNPAWRLTRPGQP